MKNLLGFTCFFVFIFFSCQSETKDTQNKAVPEKTAEEDVYTRVDIMPRFPGCEDQPKEKRASCASTKMFTYIRENIQYPEAAKTAGTEGRAVVSFVVDKSGKLRDLKVVKNPGDGLGTEAIRIIEGFPDWIPGIQKGNKVHVQYIIPVTFRL